MMTVCQHGKNPSKCRDCARHAKAEKAYRAWRRAAEIGYGSSTRDTPEHMARVDAKIRRLKARHEALVSRGGASR